MLTSEQVKNKVSLMRKSERKVLLKTLKITIEASPDIKYIEIFGHYNRLIRNENQLTTESYCDIETFIKELEL